jgi:hypothetical protein
MGILELESRCAVIRTVGSNPTLSAIIYCSSRFGADQDGVRLGIKVPQPDLHERLDDALIWVRG